MLLYTRSHHSLPVLARCASENDCIYYVNESVAKRVGTLPNVEIDLVYVPLGYDFSAEIAGNVLQIAEIEKSQVVLGKRYSVGVSAASASGSAISDDARAIIEGMTVEFRDATGFQISARSQRACTADPAGLAARYFTFVNLCQKYDIETTREADGTLGVVFRSVLGVESTFTFWLRESAVRVVFSAPDAANSSLAVANDEGDVEIAVYAQNALNVAIDVRNSGGAVADRFSDGVSENGTTTHSLDVSKLRSGDYAVWTTYTSACGEQVQETAGLTLRVPYRVPVTCTAEKCTVDLGTFNDWTGGSAAPLGAFELQDACTDTWSCANSAGEAGECAGKVTFLGVQVQCVGKVHDLGKGVTGVSGPAYEIELDFTPGAGSGAQAESLAFLAVPTLSAGDLEVTSLRVRDKDDLTHYVCFERFTPDQVLLELAGQPCTPVVESLDFHGYNLVDVGVRTCVGTRVVLKNQYLAISSLAVTNTTPVRACAGCEAWFRIDAQSGDTQNAVLSRLERGNIRVERLDTSAGVERWTDTGVGVVSFSTNENATVFSILTEGLEADAGTGARFRFFILYDDVCYYYADRR